MITLEVFYDVVILIDYIKLKTHYKYILQIKITKKYENIVLLLGFNGGFTIN